MKNKQTIYVVLIYGQIEQLMREPQIKIFATKNLAEEFMASEEALDFNDYSRDPGEDNPDGWWCAVDDELFKQWRQDEEMSELTYEIRELVINE